MAEPNTMQTECYFPAGTAVAIDMISWGTMTSRHKFDFHYLQFNQRV